MLGVILETPDSTSGGSNEPTASLTPVQRAKEDKPPLPRRLLTAPAINPVQLRKAMNQLLLLLAERDPGAKDCLRDNRTTFRSAFVPEVYAEFERLVKSLEFDTALEQLKKAARKHDISV
jgi:hypothetical protein